LLTWDSESQLRDRWELGALHGRKDPRIVVLGRLGVFSISDGKESVVLGQLDVFSICDGRESLVEALALVLRQRATALFFEARGDACSPTATTGVKASGLSLALLLLHGNHLMLRCGALEAPGGSARLRKNAQMA